jgi:outer membrane receptor protein involved in Fe transport
MQKNLRNRFVLVLALLLVCMAPAVAQTYTEGSIAGTVFDPSGAVVANAAINIHNDGTDAEVHLTADGSGYYKAAQLPAATYTLTVNATGFAPYKAVGVIVEVGLTTDVSPHLATAGTTSDVVVTGEAPILNFETPEISTVLDNHEVQDLPLNGGRWSNLTLLTPGATLDTSGFGLISFRGISTIMNNVEVDGADDNQAYYAEERGRTRAGYSTSKYMIQEFQVNTGVYSSEFGRSAGGVVNSVTKSGTNTLHGILHFEDRDNHSWGSYNDYTNNTVNTGTLASPDFVTTPYKPKDWRKQWGLDVGGPLIKDKLFWFYGYNEFHRNFPGTSKAATPSSFFTLPDAALPSGSNCNVNTTPSNLGYMSGLSSTSPTFSVDEQSCELAARLTAAGKGGYNTYALGAAAYSTQLSNLLADMGAVPRDGNLLLNTPKLDWQVNGKEHVSVLYHRMRWDSPGGVQTQATNNYAIDSFGTDFVKIDYGLAKLDSLITSNISNEVRYQYGRELNDEGQQPVSAYSKSYLQGLNGITNPSVYDFSPNITYVELDNPSSGAGIYLGSPYYSYRKALPDERKWQVGDTAAWQKGNHNIKFGVDLLHNYDILNNTYKNNGDYAYTYMGNYFADLLNEGGATGACNSTGSVTSPGSSSTTNYTGTAPCGTYYQGFGPPAWDLATMNYGFFGEDHWKLTPRLTVDAGLRYDYESLPAPYSSLVAASGNFTPYLSSTNGLCAVYTGPGTCPALAAQANITNHPSEKTNFGPRIGLAWDPYGDGKTTIRAGYGLYFGPITNGVLLNNLLNTGSPLGQYTSSTFSPNSNGAPIFPNAISSAPFGSGPTSYFFSASFKNPQIDEFDLSLQQAAGHGTVFQVSYMGALGRDLPNAVNINLNPNANTATSGNPNGVITTVIKVSDVNGLGPIPNGTLFTLPVYSKGASTTSNLLNPNFGAVNELFSNINSSYNALVAEVKNSGSKYIQFDANYTWSHALDFNQNANTTTMGNGLYDPYNIAGFNRGGNYGNSMYNIPNRFVAWALINSPKVETNNWVKYFANDWSMNPVFQMQNGLPYSAVIGSGSAAVSAYSSGLIGSGGGSWIPSLGRNTYSYPRDMILDLRLEKQIPITVGDKTYRLQLLGEAFNLANHQNVTGVSNSAYTFAANSSVTSGCTGLLVSGQAQNECSTMTFVPKTGSGHSQSGFGAVTSSNNTYLYTQRELELTLRLDF